jgi:hypothetical protein
MSWVSPFDNYWVRHDGAAVCLYDLEATFKWIAYGPDSRNSKAKEPRLSYCMRYVGQDGTMRRWKTAKAAMRAVDRAFPEVAK